MATPKPPRSPSWFVTMRDMKCLAQAELHIPDGYTGPPPNPPAPQAIECPPGMASNVTMRVEERPDKTCIANGKHVTPCPLPYGQQVVHKLAHVWTIEKRGADCHAEAEDHFDCPPGKDCNPPKPRTFPCPPGVTEDKALQIAELPDATCVVVPDGCMDTGCATEKVACPPSDALKN